MASQSARAEGTLPGRTVLLLAAYVLYVCATFLVEGAGRRTCDVPSRAWIDAGATANERALRGFRRNRAEECLDATGWYSNVSLALYGTAVIAPFLVVILYAKGPWRLVKKAPVFEAHAGAVIYGFIWLAAMAAFMIPYFGAQEFFDSR